MTLTSRPLHVVIARNITLQLMFWARLGLILAQAPTTISITLEGIKKIKTEKKNDSRTV